jgi:hypothetical protein
MIFEIDNPGDTYTLRASDFRVAAVTCVYLGRGKLALTPLDDEAKKYGEVPLFLGDGSEAWFKETFEQTLEDVVNDVMDNHRQALVDCFESVLIGSLGSRINHEAAMAEIPDQEIRERLTTERHERMRSSMNDIGAYAHRLAKAIREKAQAQAS